MPTEGERLARIEEQVLGVREDMAEMKLATKETNAILLAMNDRFLTVDRADDMRKELNKAIEDAHDNIKALDQRVSKLESWRSWIAGAVAVIGFLMGIGAEAVRTWKG